jgi:SAM-dependent methyltransferase
MPSALLFVRWFSFLGGRPKPCGSQHLPLRCGAIIALVRNRHRVKLVERNTPEEVQMESATSREQQPTTGSFKSKRVCPWWLGYVLACPLRRWWEDPRKILTPYVREGMTVLEPGPGMGFFTLELLRMIGASGRVIAVDVQPKMIHRLQRRAARAKLAGRLEARLAGANSMGLTGFANRVDFTLAFAVVHEFPSSRNFFVEVARASKAGAILLLAEPSGHVNDNEFEAEIKDAVEAGFLVVERPSIRGSHAALLKKT